MFKQRFATASILALLFASALAFFSTPIFLIFIMMVALVAGWEWSDLSRIKSKFGKVLFLVGLFISLMLAANYLSILGQYDQLLGYQICFAAMVLWAVIFLWLQGYPSSAILWSSGSIMIVLGIALLTATWVALASIISLENGRFLGSSCHVPTLPKKNNLPARLGPGSRGAVPDLASNWLLDRPLEAIMVRRWPEKLPISFLELFVSQLELILGISWEPLGSKNAIRINVVDVFVNSLLPT